jgi:hypothetical protein
MNYQKLREEAEREAREILGKNKRLGKNDLESKHNTVRTFQSAKHLMLKQSEVDHCVNNGISVEYLYNELLSKYGGIDKEEKPIKKYYTPRGTPRGRPKKDNNEQE